MKSTQSLSFSFYCERGETHLCFSFFFSFLFFSFFIAKEEKHIYAFLFSFLFYCERGEMYLILKVIFL
jgi:hypothetical protein